MKNLTSNSPGATLRMFWRRASKLPGGKLVFSKAVGWMAPYSGSIGAQVIELEPGYALITMTDRHAVRNHLNSIHAVALVNLAELTTGLAMSCGLPDHARGILAGISIEYLKKARGTLHSECKTELPATNEKREYIVEGVIRDAAGDVVARATARWLVGPTR